MVHSKQVAKSQQGFLAEYLILGCVGRGAILGSGGSSGVRRGTAASGVCKSENMDSTDATYEISHNENIGRGVVSRNKNLVTILGTV